MFIPLKSPRENQSTKGLSELTVSEGPVHDSLIPLPRPVLRGAGGGGGGSKERDSPSLPPQYLPGPCLLGEVGWPGGGNEPLDIFQ